MPPDHDPPAPPGATEPRTGPTEVGPRLLAAARRGDPGAFAQLVEHWDPHLRRFVHHVMGGEGSTDRVLAAAYVRAYRALPRYPGGGRPGLWLHRVAYLAAVDELRRLHRDPTRRRHRARPEPPPTPSDAEEGLPIGWTPDSTPLVRELRAAVVKGGRSLAPDQRALATMIDLEGFDLAAVADAFDSDPEVVAVRIRAARRILLAAAAHVDVPDVGSGTAGATSATTGPGTRRRRSGPTARRPPGLGSHRASDPLDHGVVDPFALPSWAEGHLRDEPAPPDPTDDEAWFEPTDGPDAHPADRAKVALLLASAVVPDPEPSFWSALGRRLLAEQERPAAPTPDPAARLARATPTHRVHPAEPGFAPGEISPKPVSTMAGQADSRRTRRSWRRPLAVLGALGLIGAVVAGAVAIGVSTPTPDGSVSGDELADTVLTALTASPHLRTALVVEEPAPDGPDGPVGHQLLLGRDGSWSFDRTDVIDRTTYSAAFATTQRVAVIGEGETEIASEAAVGLAPGAPDRGPEAPAALSDLQAVGTLLRADPEVRAPATRDGEGDTPTWTFTRPVASGPDGTVERWEVVVGRDDGFVRSIERRSGDALVRRTTFVRWEPMSEVDDATFVQAPPPDTPAPDVGFAPTVLDGVAWLGRGPAVTPGWLPSGYDLAAVAIRPEAPPDAPSTAAGSNPADVSVASLAYQRGPERAVVTTRALTAPATDWSDPFGPPEPGDDPVVREVLGGGRYNGTTVEVRTDAVGRAQLWGRTDDTVFTVSGDLTAPEAVQMAASLR